MALHTKTGSGSPVSSVTPDYIGQHYIDTGSNTLYQAFGTANTDWSANMTAENVKKLVDDKSANYTIVAGDRGKVINVDATSGAITLTLTAAATLGDGFWCYVRKADSSANGVVIDPNAAETVNGAATATLSTQYDQRLLVCDGTGWFLQIDTSGSGSGTSTTFAGLIENLEISTSRAGNAETIALKTAAGTDPAAGDKIRIGFRDATAGSGAYSVLEITAATSLTISSGSTLGATSGMPFRVWLVGFNDAGTFRLGVIKCLSSSGIYGLQDNVLESSTAEGGAGAADSAEVIYTGSAVTSKAMRVLGYLEYTLTTAGTWDTAPSLVHVYTPGDKLPGATVQDRSVTTSSVVNCSGVITYDTSTPQSTEGTEVFTLAVSPKFASSLIEVTADVHGRSSTALATIALFKDSGADALTVRGIGDGAGTPFHPQGFIYRENAGSTSSRTYKLRAGPHVAGNYYINGNQSGGAVWGGAVVSGMYVREIMV